MVSPNTRWSEAFLRQARSDLDAYEELAATSLPACHRLHYLQMWLEKLCKAHLWLEAATTMNMSDLHFSHNVVAKAFPALVRRHWQSIGLGAKPNTNQMRDLCREIDLLHPQVDANKSRPDNVEYPWSVLRDGKPCVVPPASEEFRVSQRLLSPSGRQLMKAAVLLTRSHVFAPSHTH